MSNKIPRIRSTTMNGRFIEAGMTPHRMLGKDYPDCDIVMLIFGGDEVETKIALTPLEMMLIIRVCSMFLSSTDLFLKHIQQDDN